MPLKTVVSDFFLNTFSLHHSPTHTLTHRFHYQQARLIILLFYEATLAARKGAGARGHGVGLLSVNARVATRPNGRKKGEDPGSAPKDSGK